MVVGGGPAGLSAALHLARYGRSVVLFDVKGGRSGFRQVNRNYLGFPEGIAITDLVALGRTQLEPYREVEVVDQQVDDVSRDHGGFRAEGWTASAVVLATGVSDNYPHFEGWEHCVGVSVFWCIACDGWESRDKEVVVAGNDDHAALEALQLRHFTKAVTLLTNSETDSFSRELLDRLERHSVPIVHDTIDTAQIDDGQLRALLLGSGSRLPLEALYSAQGISPQSHLAQGLGVSCGDGGYITVDAEQRTSAAGVVAAGDVTSLHSHAVTTAVYEGSQAAASVHRDLLPADLQ
ncbi:MAG: thioredoxin reductase [Frankiales bacterium]|nr:thioredoxin reductase [Frankiales bacterium]